ncbi:uncharacterized protein LOC126412777 [Schistocerca serialis cubense]|uniref:uncharacterized protein LOC126412777 n=1 Tax=Schistocerca serialis cubense TaxID=2023355 RepID=UPI00214F32A1|nr:uncharacterized protein LOC126412777 [Schistocerca serialis cubense]
MPKADNRNSHGDTNNDNNSYISSSSDAPLFGDGHDSDTDNDWNSCGDNDETSEASSGWLVGLKIEGTKLQRSSVPLLQMTQKKKQNEDLVKLRTCRPMVLPLNLSPGTKGKKGAHQEISEEEEIEEHRTGLC